MMRLTTIALVVSDAKKSAKWYQEKLGFEIRDHQGHWITVAPKRENMAFHLCEGFYPLEPGNTGISFTTTDAKRKEAARTVDAAGKHPRIVAMGSHGPRAALERHLAGALGIAATAALVEVVGSWWSGSLALLSDAGPVGTDAVAVGLSLAAIRLAGRPHTPKMSFGYHRIEVLAAFVNAMLLAAIASSLLV